MTHQRTSKNYYRLDGQEKELSEIKETASAEDQVVLTLGPQNDSCAGSWPQLADYCADTRALRAKV